LGVKFSPQSAEFGCAPAKVRRPQHGPSPKEAKVAHHVKQIMTAKVETARPDMTLKEAAERMRLCDIGMLPVCDGQKIIGAITDRDIAIRATAEGSDPEITAVSDVMTASGICFCFEDDDVKDVAALMRDRQVRRIPVVDRKKHLVGIVSLGDIAQHSDERTAGATLEGVSQQAHGATR
jgi:CBS domain-containing protein